MSGTSAPSGGADLSAAGFGASALGSSQSGGMTAATLDAQADNQMQQAQEAEEAGQFNAMKEQLQANQKIGTATAAYGASGVTTNSGSEMEVLRESAQNAELDRLNILHGADVKSINYQNQAALNRYGANAASAGAFNSSLGSIIRGAGTIWQSMSAGGSALGEGASTDLGAAGDSIGGSGAASGGEAAVEDVAAVA